VGPADSDGMRVDQSRLQQIELSLMSSHTACNAKTLALFCLLGVKMSDNLNVSKGKKWRR